MKIIKITKHKKEYFDALRDDPSYMSNALKEHIAILKKMKKEGKLLDAYFLPGDGRAIFIFDLESEEELDNNILQDPMQLTFDIEMHPAVPIFEHIGHALKTME